MKVLMKFYPTGEVREVEISELPALMAAGWHQAPAGAVVTAPVLQAPANENSPATPAEEN
jgi:hypothetical protein